MNELVVRRASHSPQPGEVLVEVLCKKCGRRWGDLAGGADGAFRIFTNYVEPTIEMDRSAGERSGRYDTRNGQRDSVASQAYVIHRMGPPAETSPDGRNRLLRPQEYERWLVVCHRRCGRQTPLRRDTLAAAFREAVERGHSDTRL